MKRFLIILVWPLLMSPVSGQELSNIQASFLEVGFGARAMAMGGAFTALASNAYGTTWNPAGIAWQTGAHSAALSTVRLAGLVNYHHFAYSYLAPRWFGAGAMILTSGDDLMRESTISVSGVTSGALIPDLAMLRNLSVGMNVKYYTTSFGNNADGAYLDADGLNHQVKGNASGYGVDLALSYKLSGRDRIGLMYRNPLNSISWESSNEVGTALGSYSENLPAELIVGYARLSEHFTFALDYNKSLHADTEDIIYTGLEFPLLPGLLGRYLLLRGGYSQELLTGTNKIYSFGGGTRVELFTTTVFALDLAYQIQPLWKGHNHFRISLDLLL